MDDYLRQRLIDWADPRKRAAYLRQDALELRQHFAQRELAQVRGRIKLRYAAMVDAGPAATRRRRRLPSIYGRR